MISSFKLACVGTYSLLGYLKPNTLSSERGNVLPRNTYDLNYKVICLFIKRCSEDVIDFSVCSLV